MSSGTDPVVLNHLCTQTALGTTGSRERWSKGLPFRYMPGRKGMVELRKGQNPMWFQVSVKSTEGLEERRPSRGNLGTGQLEEPVRLLQVVAPTAPWSSLDNFKEVWPIGESPIPRKYYLYNSEEGPPESCKFQELLCLACLIYFPGISGASLFTPGGKVLI